MSSGSESDDDYIPGEPEQVSEEDSADEETDIQYNQEQEHKAKKRKAVQEKKGKKKRRAINSVKETLIEEENEDKDKLNLEDPIEDKKREDDLWAMFLDGTDSKPKVKETKAVEPVKPEANKAKLQNKEVEKKNEDDKARERRIFEFAGETIVVENNVIKEKIKTADKPATVSKLDLPSRSRSGGLSDLVGQLNKKNKLSTLEKTKLDWDTYKKDEGIEEEIQNHNKGKAGYLERQDFLERADVRSYEIERDLRMSRRSNR